MWTKLEDGSIIAADGEVIYFSAQRFVADICEGDRCFLCGADPSQKPFNNEHILPEWLLRRYGLFDQNIRLTNLQGRRYGTYTVPCCAACNSMMGELLEQPISEALRDFNTLDNYLKKNGVFPLFVWMGLIFLKTHLKDKEFRFHLDARRGTETIADLHDWGDLHHIHSVVRAYFNGGSVDKEAAGSFLVLPIRSEGPSEPFDFADLTFGQTLMMRFSDFALLAVFNDSGAVMSRFGQKLRRITGAVSDLQLREIFAEFAFLNIHLKERTTFHSEFDMNAETCRVSAMRPPSVELLPLDLNIRGQMLEHVLSHALPKMHGVGYSNADLVAAVKAGTMTFLFGEDDKFIETTFDLSDTGESLES